MPRFHIRRISDPVHGTFGLSAIESEIVSTAAFQRLHNVKQLGLAHLVYPGADYSRFSHSLGACHLAGRMVRGINQNCFDQRISDDQIQMYRLAGLLHDLGHYPFSHAMEQVIGNFYKEALLDKPKNPLSETTRLLTDVVEEAEPTSYDHETLGRAIIDNDDELNSVFKKHGFDRQQIKSFFSRENPELITNIVSSDLDCDRLDYLVRTARATGLPYGQVDVEYITSQACIDSSGNFCITAKAMRAADHLLVSRHYDYTQVVYHKTVVGLEIVLKEILEALFKEGRLDCSAAKLRNEIKSGTFRRYDDHFVVSQIREFRSEIPDADFVRKAKLDSLLKRRPPKLVVSSERFDERKEEREREYKNRASQLRDKIPKWADEFGIPQELWYVWEKSAALSKVGSSVEIGDVFAFEEERDQSIRILQGKPSAKTRESKLLVSCEAALMHKLANLKLYYLRLFVHVPEDDGKHTQQKIAEAVKRDLPHFGLTA
jgi:HD superfamily phosphohydrolase